VLCCIVLCCIALHCVALCCAAIFLTGMSMNMRSSVILSLIHFLMFISLSNGIGGAISKQQEWERCAPVARPVESITGHLKCVERHQMDIYIASAGGTGSNFLYTYLCKFGFALGSRALDYGARWCHSLDPITPDLVTSHHIKRAIFLYSVDPLKQLQSMYRQGYTEVNYRKKVGLPSKLTPHVDKTKLFPPNLKEYCNQPHDLAAIEAQWKQWVKVSVHSKVSFPILAIQFEHLWDHLPALFRFVNLPLEHLLTFPGRKKRQSRDDDSKHVDGCALMYDSLKQNIRNTSKLMVIWDGNIYNDIKEFFDIYAEQPRHSPLQRGCNDSVSDWDGGAKNYHLHIKQ
jgi:hypothetical protein